jgi:hypothetical protein
MKERGGKVKAMIVNRTNKATLQGKIHNNIQAKSTIVTDSKLLPPIFGWKFLRRA